MRISKGSMKERLEQYKRHKSFLKEIKSTSLYCPRYDMLSLNNNLLLHRNYDPKQQLVPQPAPKGLREIEREIQAKSRPPRRQEMVAKTKWYEQVLRKGDQMEKKFKFEYSPASTPSFSVREQLNKIYNFTRQSWSKSRNSSFNGGFPQ